jgi:hypothetical protein
VGEDFFIFEPWEEDIDGNCAVLYSFARVALIISVRRTLYVPLDVREHSAFRSTCVATYRNNHISAATSNTYMYVGEWRGKNKIEINPNSNPVCSQDVS